MLLEPNDAHPKVRKIFRRPVFHRGTRHKLSKQRIEVTLDSLQTDPPSVPWTHTGSSLASIDASLTMAVGGT
jgi:hypothetical protein